MRCPYCGSLDDKVIESRTLGSEESIRRRRESIDSSVNKIESLSNK